MAKVFLSYRRADQVPRYLVKSIGRMCIDSGFEHAFVDVDVGAIPVGSNY